MSPMSYQIYMIALCLWREARNQNSSAIVAVASVIRNRKVDRGDLASFEEVILQPYQFSSFNRNDPQYHKYPEFNSVVWINCLDIAEKIFNNELADNTSGARFYFDKSLDENPPLWSRKMIHTCDIGDFHFYRERTVGDISKVNKTT
jgi:spore germination cell wall hydrolase CwlJ-like protein